MKTLITGCLLAFFSGVKLSSRIKFSFSSKKTVYTSCIIFFSVFVTLGLMRWWALTPEKLDFGNFHQALGSFRWGGLLESSLYAEGFASRLGGHFEPILILFTPFYLIWFHPVWMIGIQSFCVTLTGYLLFRGFRKELGEPAAAILCISFFLFPAVHFVTLLDFHSDTLAMPALLGTWLAARNKNPLAFWMLFSLSALTKEYAALVLIMIGVEAFFNGWKYHGILAMASGIVWFVTVMEVLIPFFNQGNPSGVLVFFYGERGAGEGIAGIAGAFFSNPLGFVMVHVSQKTLENLVYLFVPLLGICFLGPWQMLIASPILFKDLLAGLDIGNHRLAMALPFLFAAIGTAWIRYPSLKKPTGLILSVLVATIVLSPVPPGQRFFRSLDQFFPDKHDQLAKQFLAKIPGHASVSAAPHLVPRLSNRKLCYVFPGPVDKREVEFILVDISPALRDFNWVSRVATIDSLEALKQNPGFRLLDSGDGLWLFKRTDY